MKTEALIKMLGTNPEPVRPRELARTMLMALGVSVAVVSLLCLLWSVFHGPMPMTGGPNWRPMVVALVLTLGLVLVGAGLLFKLAQPGQNPRGTTILFGALVASVLGASVLTLHACGESLCTSMMAMGSWGTCLLCIPLFAAIPFGTLIWVLRGSGPTRLATTGAVSGLVAGALGAAGVAVHQMAASAPLMVLWFGAPILLCALIGAVLGPRLLRW